MSDTPDYGKTGEKKVLDNHGSTLHEKINYREGQIVYPVRRDYEYRHPCEKTDLETLAKIAQSLLDDPAKLDTSLRLEKRPVGGDDRKYYIVECFTKLVY